MRLRLLFLGVFSFSLCALQVIAQDAAPTAESVNKEIATYKTERAEAEKKFGKAELTTADEYAAKAEAALAAGDTSKALKLIVEARWQVPFTPAGLPENVSRVLGQGRLRHGDRVNALAYSPDGNFLVSGARDGTARIWSLGNGREVMVYRGHENEKVVDDPKEKEKANLFRVPAVAFSPDGKYVASAGAKEIHVWDAKTGKKEYTLKGFTKDVKCVAFASKDSNLLASGDDDKKIMLWDVAKEKAIYTPDAANNNLNSIAFSQDDAYLAACDQSGHLYVYSLKQERKLALSVNVAGNSRSGSLALIDNGSGIAVGVGNGQIVLMAGPGGFQKAAEGSTVHRFEGHNKEVNGVAVTRDGKLMVSVSKDETVNVWDVTSRKQIRSYKGHSSDVTCVAIRPDGRQAASADDDGNIKLWPLSALDEHKAFSEATDSLWTTAFSPDSKTFTTGGADKSVRVYEASSGKVLKTLTGHKNAVTAVAYLTGEKVVSGSGDKLVKIWSIADEKAVDCTGHTSAVLAVATDEGKLIVSGSADRTVRGWDANGKSLWTFTGKSAVCAVSIQKGGKRVAIGTADGMLTILDTSGSEPKPIGSTQGHQSGVLGVAFAPNGDRLATGGGDGSVRVWTLPDSGTPAALTKFDPPIKTTGTGATFPAIVALSYSQDGRFLVAGGAETVVRIWDVQAGVEFRGLRGPTDWVTSASFAPDARSVIAVGVDKKARFFELPKNETTAPPGHTKQCRCVAVSRDGKLIATGAEDNTIKIWDAATGREVNNILVPKLKNDTRIDALSFIGNETLVVTGKYVGLFWFDIKTGKEVRRVASEDGFTLAVPPETKKVVLAYVKKDGQNLVGGFEIFPEKGETQSVKSDLKKLSSAYLSPDGAWGIVGAEDGVIRIWDLDKRERVKGDWPIVKGAVADVGLSPDRKTIVAVDSDGTVKIANTDTREVSKTLDKVVQGEPSVIVSPKGNAFCVMSSRGELKTFDLEGKEIRTWKLPFAPNAAVFTVDGKKIITANIDGTGFVLDMP